MQYPIPDPCFRYTIDDDTVVRNSKGRVVNRKVGAPSMFGLWDSQSGRLIYFNALALLAWSRDGVPIPPKTPPKRPRPPKISNGVRTLTLHQHWNELREKAGLDPFEYS